MCEKLAITEILYSSDLLQNNRSFFHNYLKQNLAGYLAD